MEINDVFMELPKDRSLLLCWFPSSLPVTQAFSLQLSKRWEALCTEGAGWELGNSAGKDLAASIEKKSLLNVSFATLDSEQVKWCKEPWGGKRCLSWAQPRICFQTARGKVFLLIQKLFRDRTHPVANPKRALWAWKTQQKCARGAFLLQHHPQQKPLVTLLSCSFSKSGEWPGDF